jgi:hypothetical protein
MIRLVSALILLASLLAGSSTAAGAQEVFGAAALVSAEAPIYLLPDATRTPLRTLPPGLPLTLLARKGDWLQVTFEDAQLGRRTGWIESRFVRIREAEPQAPPPGPPAPAARPPAGTAPTPAAPAAGQPRPAARRPRPAAPPGVRLFGTFAADAMTASDSFEAVTGSATVTSYGGGVQFTNLWRGLFVEGAIERSQLDGERVFVFRDEVFKLGIPVEVTMTPIDVVVGWRAGHGRLVPYVAGGATWFRYEETSDFADEDENVDERKVGFVVRAGVEVAVARWVHLRGDVRYRQVNDVLGVAGASAAFEEDRLGGFGAAVSVLIGR